MRACPPWRFESNERTQRALPIEFSGCSALHLSLILVTAMRSEIGSFMVWASISTDQGGIIDHDQPAVTPWPKLFLMLHDMYSVVDCNSPIRTMERLSSLHAQSMTNVQAHSTAHTSPLLILRIQWMLFPSVLMISTQSGQPSSLTNQVCLVGHHSVFLVYSCRQRSLYRTQIWRNNTFLSTDLCSAKIKSARIQSDSAEITEWLLCVVSNLTY